jgi:hypothetical protein
MEPICSDWELPPGAIHNCEVRVVQYVESDGKIAYDVKHAGICPLSTYIGLLELAKRAIIDQFYAENSD